MKKEKKDYGATIFIIVLLISIIGLIIIIEKNEDELEELKKSDELNQTYSNGFTDGANALAVSIARSQFAQDGSITCEPYDLFFPIENQTGRMQVNAVGCGG